jgi:hypothetical protein
MGRRRKGARGPKGGRKKGYLHIYIFVYLHIYKYVCFKNRRCRSQGPPLIGRERERDGRTEGRKGREREVRTEGRKGCNEKRGVGWE